MEARHGPRDGWMDGRTGWTDGGMVGWREGMMEVRCAMWQRRTFFFPPTETRQAVGTEWLDRASGLRSSGQLSVKGQREIVRHNVGAHPRIPALRLPSAAVVGVPAADGYRYPGRYRIKQPTPKRRSLLLSCFVRGNREKDNSTQTTAGINLDFDVGLIRTDAPEGTRFLVLRIRPLCHHARCVSRDTAGSFSARIFSDGWFPGALRHALHNSTEVGVSQAPAASGTRWTWL